MELTGPEKAVLFLLSLDEQVAADVVTELGPDRLRKLRDVASVMRDVPASELERVFGEFVERSSTLTGVPRGGLPALKRIVTRALGGDTSQEIFVDAPPSPLERLASSDPRQLAAILEREHPQIVAVLLSQLDPSRAVALVTALPDALQASVLSRLARMREVPAGVLEEMASALTAELPEPGPEGSVSVDGVSLSAGLVRRLGKDACERLLTNLEEEDAELSAEIRRAMYTFEDLKAIDKRAMRELLKAVPADRLVLALKTASEGLREHLFSSMSKRAADVLRDDLALLGGVRLADVEAAQQEIVETALRLQAEGVLSLGGDEDALV